VGADRTGFAAQPAAGTERRMEAVRTEKLEVVDTQRAKIAEGGIRVVVEVADSLPGELVAAAAAAARHILEDQEHSGSDIRPEVAAAALHTQHSDSHTRHHLKCSDHRIVEGQQHGACPY
jgi:hypothetical protein